MRTFSSLALPLALGLMSVGCGSASFVRRGAYSGELALRGAAIPARHSAESAMLEHCQGRVEIVDATTGAQLAVRDAAAASKPDNALTEGERVHYLCVTRMPRN